MMRKIKRIAAVLLSLSLCFSFSSKVAYADESEGGVIKKGLSGGSIASASNAMMLDTNTGNEDEIISNFIIWEKYESTAYCGQEQKASVVYSGDDADSIYMEVRLNKSFPICRTIEVRQAGLYPSLADHAVSWV